MSAVVNNGDCKNCPAPVERIFGKWEHHWIFSNACQTPELAVSDAERQRK